MGRTVWNSPVSQNPTPGITPGQAFATTIAATATPARTGSSTARRSARASISRGWRRSVVIGSQRSRVEGSPAKDVPPDDAPQVHGDRDADQGQSQQADAVPAGHPNRDEGQGERDEVVAEAVPELDPALAEVHEVDEGDDDHRDEGPGDQPRAAAPEGRQQEEVGRAGEQDAHADRLRLRDGAVLVEEPAAGARLRAGRVTRRAERREERVRQDGWCREEQDLE